MKFIVGIGNPEKKYDKTRHNIGFKVLRDLCITVGAGSPVLNKKFNEKICTAGGNFFVEPQTFVNQTGATIKALIEEHHPNPKDVLVVCDDVNLMFAKLRLRESGSAGGHHGLESIIEAFGSDDFPRLRLGVGNQSMPKDDLTEFVLGKFDLEEEKRLDSILETAVLVCETWMNEGFERAINRLSQLQSMNERE